MAVQHRLLAPFLYLSFLPKLHQSEIFGCKQQKSNVSWIKWKGNLWVLLVENSSDEAGARGWQRRSVIRQPYYFFLLYCFNSAFLCFGLIPMKWWDGFLPRKIHVLPQQRKLTFSWGSSKSGVWINTFILEPVTVIRTIKFCRVLFLFLFFSLP